MMDDTTPEAKRHYYSVIRAMSESARAEQLLCLSRMVKQLGIEGIRGRHPEYNDEQIHYAYLRIIMGKKEFQTAFPSVEIAP